MNMKEFYKIIALKQKKILRENEEARTRGDTFKIICNCNFLKGVSYVLARLRSVK